MSSYYLRRIYIIIILLLSVSPLFSQDIIIKKTGEEIQAKVVEIDDLKIKYRKVNQKDGPIYNIAKEEVFMIKYSDGTRDLFSTTAPPKPNTNTNKPEEKKPDPVVTKPTQPTYTPPPPATSPPASGNSERFALMISSSVAAPFSFYMAGLNEDNVGLYLGTRLNLRSISNTTSASYAISDGEIDDDFWVWQYSGVSDYRRGSLTGGITYGFGENLYMYTGLGYGYATYAHAYYQYGQSGNYYGVEWLEDEDLSTEGLETEAGLILDLGGFNLNLGVANVNFSEFSLTFGLGFSF